MGTARIELKNQLALPSPIPATPSYSEAERQQQEHYDRIADQYEAHYSDPCSRLYRRRFIYQPMFDGLNLSGMKVLDAMCGSGQTSEYLLSSGAEVTGLDISSEVIEAFRRRWPESNAVCRSALDTGLESESFDCVAVVGGLHHMHPFLYETISEMHRVLRPGGYLCFMEPHSGSIPDLVRRVWYKHDRFFSDNEAAIDLCGLESEFSSHFRFNRVKYMGSVGFLLVLNSMIFR
nr:class I SAM-dependent methyltransferase [Acidobacteriota bacterium]